METTKTDPNSAENLLRQKTEEVAALREEGEKLSKKHFQLETIIKGLRAKEKEKDAAISNLEVSHVQLAQAMTTSVGATEVLRAAVGRANGPYPHCGRK